MKKLVKLTLSTLLDLPKKTYIPVFDNKNKKWRRIDYIGIHHNEVYISFKYENKFYNLKELELYFEKKRRRRNED